MLLFLRLLRGKYGSAALYLKCTLGFTDSELLQLQSFLLEDRGFGPRKRMSDSLDAQDRLGDLGDLESLKRDWNTGVGISALVRGADSLVAEFESRRRKELMGREKAVL
jgi:hypothetical protein